MKNLLKTLCLVFMIAVSFGFVGVASLNKPVSAEEPATAANYAKVWSNDLAGFTQTGAGYDAATNSVTYLGPGCRMGYAVAENAELSTIIRFSSITGGNVNFHMRLQGDVPNATYTTLGYQFRWYSSGQFEFLKGGVAVIGATWGPLPAPAVETDYVLKMSTVNYSDGSVKIVVSVNGSVFVDYTDTADIITGAGLFAVMPDGFILSKVGGNGFANEAIWLGDAALPATNANFSSTQIANDGKVTVNTDGIMGGASWAFQQSEFISYKFKFTPAVAGAGRLHMTIGGQPGSHGIHRPDILGDWGWAETGYHFIWWGYSDQIHLMRNNVQLANIWSKLGTFEADRTYEIEYGVTPFEDGSNRIHVKVDGLIKIIFFDMPTAEYTPLRLTSTGVPGALVRHNFIAGESATGVIDPGSSNVAVDENTLLTTDVGQSVATSSTATFDRNGGITSYPTGVVAAYNGNFKNTSITFDATFESVGSFAVQLRAQGTDYDTPWGGAWTNKGYMILFFGNGQVVLSKNGAAICEGWSLSSTQLGTDFTYPITVGTINLNESTVRVFASIGSNPVINYVDTINPINNEGWFTIFNNAGCAGTFMPHDVEYPEITSSVNVGETVLTNTPVTLNYSLSTADAGDVVTYHVDTTKSTAEATIVDNTVTATTAGNVVVYACVNGVYSNDITITAELPPYPVVTNLPTAPIIVGDAKWSIDAKMSDEGTVTTKTFGITNVSGEATIDATTGEITPVKAGTVKVYAVVNGIKSEENIITIIPKVFINKVGSFAFGGVYDLNDYYSANCDLPNENIVVTFEIVSGGEYATLNAQGVLTVGSNPGTVGLKAYITGETFQAVSAVTTIAIERPIVVVQNDFLGDLYVGQSVTLNPSVSQGGIEITTAEIVAISGADCVEINGLQVTAVKVGTFKYKVKINGSLIDDDEGLEIAIEKLVPTIIANDEMAIGRSQQAEIMFNTNDGYVYTNAVWSVVEGNDVVTVSNTGLISAVKQGEATIKVVVDQIGEATLNIVVYGKVVLFGITENQEVLVGSTIDLSYRVYDAEMGEVTTVNYVVVSGKDCVTLTQDGKIEAVKSGTVKVKVVVNGVESQVITFKVTKNETSGLGRNTILWIVLGSVGGGLIVIAGTTIGIVFGVKHAKAKKLGLTKPEKAKKQKKNKNGK